MEMENYLELSEECSQMIGMFVCLKNDDLSNQIAYFKDVAFYSTIAELVKMTLTAKAQLQDLESGQDFEMELSRFYKTYELINKSSLPSLRFQKSIHTSVIWFGEGIKAMEIFVIQLSSHFSKKSSDWQSIAKDLYIEIKTTFYSETIDLASLITNQSQPVFYFPKKYPINHNKDKPLLRSKIEFFIGEHNPVIEDYEVTIFIKR